MTIEQMHQEALLRLNKVGAYRNRDLVPGELDVYLNNAIASFVKDRIEPLSNRFRRGFESSPKRLADLNTLVSYKTKDALYRGDVQSIEVDYIERPDDYLYLLSIGSVILKQGDITTEMIDGKIKRRVVSVKKTHIAQAKYIPHDDINIILEDPFNKPSKEGVVYNEFGDGFSIYTPQNCVVDTALITYLKQPATVFYDVDTSSNSVDCDLPEQTHDEIIALAVKSMVSDVGKLGKQQQLINLNETE